MYQHYALLTRMPAMHATRTKLPSTRPAATNAFGRARNPDPMARLLPQICSKQAGVCAVVASA